MKLLQLLGFSIFGVFVTKVTTQFRDIRFIKSFFEKTSSSITFYRRKNPSDTNSYYQCASECSLDHMCTRFEFCPNSLWKKCTLYQSGSTCYEESNEKTNAGCKCFRLELMKYEDGTCRCPVGYHGHGQQCCQHVIKDCTEGVMFDTLNQRKNVITFIKPLSYSGKPFEVLCSFTWGGFTVFQKRRNIDDAIDFSRNWIEYRDGFGTVHANYWLGLEKMYHILQNGDVNGFTLHIHLLDEVYSHCMWYVGKFNLQGESSNYTATFLNTKLSNDNWCDGMFNSLTPDSKPFSTYDHIGYPNTFNCSGQEQSGWWFADDIDCSFSNLNVQRIDGDIVIKTANGSFITTQLHAQIIRNT